MYTDEIQIYYSGNQRNIEQSAFTANTELNELCINENNYSSTKACVVTYAMRMLYTGRDIVKVYVASLLYSGTLFRRKILYWRNLAVQVFFAGMVRQLVTGGRDLCTFQL